MITRIFRELDKAIAIAMGIATQISREREIYLTNPLYYN